MTAAVIFKTLVELLSFYDDQTVFLVDIPIGLPSEKVERTCDIDACSKRIITEAKVKYLSNSLQKGHLCRKLQIGEPDQS